MVINFCIIDRVLHTNITKDGRRFGEICSSSWTVAVASSILIQADIIRQQQVSVYEVRISFPEESVLRMSGRLVEDAKAFSTQLFHGLDDLGRFQLTLKAHLDLPRRHARAFGEQNPAQGSIS